MKKVIALLLLLASPAAAKPMVDCGQAADGLLKIWPTLQEIGNQHKRGATLLKDRVDIWEIPSFAFWRAATEKQMGSKDLVWNTVIIYSDSLLQCAQDGLKGGEKAPKSKDLDFYKKNRTKVLKTLSIG